jgi:hypothetical protein
MLCIMRGQAGHSSSQFVASLTGVNSLMPQPPHDFAQRLLVLAYEQAPGRDGITARQKLGESSQQESEEHGV